MLCLHHGIGFKLYYYYFLEKLSLEWCFHFFSSLLFKTYFFSNILISVFALIRLLSLSLLATFFNLLHTNFWLFFLSFFSSSYFVHINIAIYGTQYPFFFLSFFLLLMNGWLSSLIHDTTWVVDTTSLLCVYLCLCCSLWFLFTISTLCYQLKQWVFSSVFSPLAFSKFEFFFIDKIFKLLARESLS